MFDSFTLVYIRLDPPSDSFTLIYIRLHSSCNLSTLVYILYTRLVTCLHSSTLVYMRLHSSSDSSVFLEQFIFKNVSRKNSKKIVLKFSDSFFLISFSYHFFCYFCFISKINFFSQENKFSIWWFFQINSRTQSCQKSIFISKIISCFSGFK